MFDLNRYLKERAELVRNALECAVPRGEGADSRLFEAMRYSLLGGGKRLRPVLALAACETVGGACEAALGLACAVEMIHTYSLIHDDLPCMDDDDLRHGLATNHKVFGDAIATLAGDALVTDAFKILARSALAGVSAERVLATVAELSEAAGSAGMVGGQVIDILSEGKRLGSGELKLLHSKKTGAMFRASILGGARLGGASNVELEALDEYARALGLAFQVVDDLLDVEATTEQMGKRTGKDEAAGKNTFPTLLGLEESHGFARELERRAHGALAGFGARAQALREIATFVVERGR
ncbi:MAG: polyprenyl synthetase family protein [Candidatus Binataceae bacterium]